MSKYVAQSITMIADISATKAFMAETSAIIVIDTATYLLTISSPDKYINHSERGERQI